jgi:benzaldehyde dehydrogenase (NAD)
VAMVSFTGSTATGRRVGELAGRHLKKVSLELGGNNAFIVLDDADVAVAASAGAWGSYLHQGQICLTAGRHLVHEAIADRYAKALCERAQALKVGNPAAEDVALGPIINQRQLDRVDRIVRDTVAAGARVRTGGTHDGLFYRKTVLEGVEPTMRAFTDEIFGPVAPITTFSTDEEVVELANRTEYGLVAGIHTRTMARGLRIANRLRTAMVHVNDQTVNDEAHVPFGGMGASGLGGRSGGEANLEEFTERRWIGIQRTAVEYPY